MQTAYVIEGGRVIDPQAGFDGIRDVFVCDGLIADSLPSDADVKRIDMSGRWILPGLLDIHAHFRDPGDGKSETLASGAAAAAAGGFTGIVTMPNPVPPVDTPEEVKRQKNFRFQDGAVTIYPSACCTVGRAGKEPADIAALRAAGAIAFTDDGAMVSDRAVMKTVMERAAACGAVVMDHAVIPSKARGGVIRDCAAARRFGLPVFPDEAETAAVAQDIGLCRETGCRVHIQHLSCAGSVELIRDARAEGLPVTAEATPHHLMFSTDDIFDDDSNFKMNPPLGTPDDVAALRRAVAEGVISCFATDHAPHSAELKSGGFLKSAFGVIGLSTAAGATLESMTEETGITVLEWASLWTVRPAAVIGIEPPSLAAGKPARFCMVDPVERIVHADRIVSLSSNSPFAGRSLASARVFMPGRSENTCGFPEKR